MLVLWLGPWPEFLPIYQIAASANSKWVDFHLFGTSNFTLQPGVTNMFFHQISQTGIEQRVRDKIGLDRIGMTEWHLPSTRGPKVVGRKLCDLKPFLGYLFAEVLDDYDWWGYTDLDMILGDFSHFINNDLLNKHDVISVGHRPSVYNNGNFMLYRTEPKFRRLWLRSKDWQRVFKDFNYQVFDEWWNNWPVG